MIQSGVLIRGEYEWIWSRNPIGGSGPPIIKWVDMSHAMIWYYHNAVELLLVGVTLLRFVAPSFLPTFRSNHLPTHTFLSRRGGAQPRQPSPTLFNPPCQLRRPPTPRIMRINTRGSLQGQRRRYSLLDLLRARTPSSNWTESSTGRCLSTSLLSALRFDIASSSLRNAIFDLSTPVFSQSNFYFSKQGFIKINLYRFLSI